MKVAIYKHLLTLRTSMYISFSTYTMYIPFSSCVFNCLKTFSSSISCFSTKKRKGVDDANYVIIAMYTAIETTIILLIKAIITEWYENADKKLKMIIY